MKKLVVFLSPVLLLLLVSCSSPRNLTKSKQPHDVILTSFHVELNNFDSDDFYNGNYGTLLLSLRDDAMENADLNMVHEAYTPSQNKGVKAELDSTFTVLKNGLQKYNWNLLPADYLKGKVPYDDYGFPQGGQSTHVGKSGDASLKVNIYLSANDLETNYQDPNDLELIYQPRIGMDVKMVSAKGKTIWDKTAYENSDKEIIIDENMTGGIQTLQVEQIPSFPNMVHEALKEMLKNKKKS